MLCGTQKKNIVPYTKKNLSRVFVDSTMSDPKHDNDHDDHSDDNLATSWWAITLYAIAGLIVLYLVYRGIRSRLSGGGVVANTAPKMANLEIRQLAPTTEELVSSLTSM